MQNNKQWIWVLLFEVILMSACSTTITTEAETPVVKKVYPSADTLPENLLRMYIQFSKPMKTIDNLEKIKLVDEKEQEIVGAIFNNVHELWDKEQKQLTIIFDPSRVKTGLDANERMGRALQAGKTYQLVIGQLEDVEGNTLPSVFTKSFYVSEEDQIIPNTALWTLKIPKSGSTSPLIIEFPAMLDHLSLLQRLQITNSNNQPIAGKIEIAKQETEWRFTPTEKWETGDYILYIHGRLEDPCGNNLNGLFDHKIGSLKNEKEEFIESINIKISK